jgi:hypothetical protein
LYPKLVHVCGENFVIFVVMLDSFLFSSCLFFYLPGLFYAAVKAVFLGWVSVLAIHVPDSVFIFMSKERWPDLVFSPQFPAPIFAA